MSYSTEKVLLAAKNFCVGDTELQVNDLYSTEEFVNSDAFYCNFLCIVHDYKKQDLGSSIKSKIFKMKKNECISWYLVICPYGNSERNKDYVFVYLCPSFTKSINVQTEFSISLFNKNNKFQIINKDSREFNIDSTGFGWEKCIKKDVVENCLQDDKLILFCCIKAWVKADSTLRTMQLSEIKGDPIEDSVSISEVVQETVSSITWKNLYQDAVLSDFTLIVDKKEIKVHKCVLAAASPVFLEILKKEEASADSIEIMDASYEIIQEMLRFIYLNKVENLHNIAHELITVAAKYGIKDLKTLCEKTLSNNINIDNIGKIVVIADVCDAMKLMDAAIRFITKNRTTFKNLPECEQIINSSNRLKNKLLLSLM